MRHTGPESHPPTVSIRPVRVLIVDKTAVLDHVRKRWDRLASTSDLDVTLLVPDRWIENYRRYDFRPDPSHRYRSVVGRVLFHGRELLGFYRSGLRRAFRVSRPDVVLMMEESFSAFGLQVARARRRQASGARLIFYNNNIVSYDLPGFRLSRLYRWIGRRVTPQADLGLCVNRRALDVLEAAGHGTPGVELFYGVDDHSFRPARDHDELLNLRAELDIPRDRTVVLCLGRLLEGKGYQDVIEATARALENRPELPLHLLLVGSGPWEQELAALAERRLPPDSFRFIPALPFEDIPRLMRAVDAHILPSHPDLNEQFGRVNVEAMLSGVLAIASRTGGMPDVIGDGGILFEPGDVDDLADLLVRLVTRPETFEEIRLRGRDRALQLYSVQRFVDELRRIILSYGAAETVHETAPMEHGGGQ